MDMIISYAIKGLIASGVLYAYYLVALRNKKFHGYNRWYLLVSVVLSLVIPFMHFSWHPIGQPGDIKVVRFLEVINNFPFKKYPRVYYAPELIVGTCYCLIGLFLLVLLFFKIIWIYRVKQAGHVTKFRGFDFIETNVEQAPFSFLNNLFWKHKMPLTDAIGRQIFKHELTHIQQRHSYDKMFMQVVTCIGWMNPFYWIIQKELDAIHEFIADAASIAEGDGRSLAMMMLQVHDEGRYRSPSHYFFNSSIKRRLIMITSSRKVPYAYARRVMALPLTLLLVGLFSIRLTAQTDDKVNGTVDHIEIYGETGKADTATIFFKNGKIEIQILNTLSGRSIFNKKYGELLSRPPGKVANKGDSIPYEPLDPVPGSIRNITFGPQTIWLERNDGTKEQYNLNSGDGRARFESRYGVLKFKKNN